MQQGFEKIEATAPAAEVPTIKVDYELTDSYGRVLPKTGNIEVEKTFIAGELARFDGYFETPFGNFGFQGWLDKAQDLHKKIEKYVEIKSELSKLEATQKKNAEEKRKREARYRSHDEDKPLVEIWRIIKETDTQVYILKTEQVKLEEQLKPYRI
ncbi:MAG: hypothetical protein AAB511_03115 [Patescibacteria group bacterium]